MSVYRTAAARMPSTAPLEREVRPTSRMILSMRREKRIREVVAERNCRMRKIVREEMVFGWAVAAGAISG